jgi:hypothetical protein
MITPLRKPYQHRADDGLRAAELTLDPDHMSNISSGWRASGRLA